MNREFAIRRFEIDFDNFIEQMLGSPNFIKDGFEQLALDFGDTDQAGVKRNIRKLPARPRIARRTTKSTLFRVTRVQSPSRMKRFSAQSLQPAFPIQTT
jgi:hypothetical protein